MGLTEGIWPMFKRPTHPAVVAMWRRILGDVTLDEYSAAVSVLVELGQKYAPQLPDLKAMVNELRREAAPLWAEVWHEIVEHVRNIPDREPKDGSVWPAERPWSSPVVERFVGMVGLEAVAMCTDEDVRVLEAQMRVKYEAMVKRERESAVLANAVGRSPRLEQARRETAGFVSLPESIKRLEGEK